MSQTVASQPMPNAPAHDQWPLKALKRYLPVAMNRVIEPRIPGTMTGRSIFDEFSERPPNTVRIRKEIDNSIAPCIRSLRRPRASMSSHANVIRKKYEV